MTAKKFTPDLVRHTCPVHGVQDFIRMEAFMWWKCPEYHGDHSKCRSVILYEDLTPDGVDVVQYNGGNGSFADLVQRYREVEGMTHTGEVDLDVG